MTKGSRFSKPALIWLLSSVTVSQAVAGARHIQTAQASHQDADAARAEVRVGRQQLIGKPAPSFATKTLDNKQVSLADYKGKALVVNFWATWCEPCRQEMPWLSELREKYSAQGFEVLGIVTDRASPENISLAIRSSRVKYPILFCNHAIAQAYGGLPELPVSFFIDRHGTIVAEMTGADSKEEIETRIKQILKK